MKEADKMLKRSLRQFRRRQKRLLQHVERLERLLAVRPTEIHNHFEAGCTLAMPGACITKQPPVLPPTATAAGNDNGGDGQGEEQHDGGTRHDGAKAGCFVHDNGFVRSQVCTVVKAFYQGQAVNLALLEVLLFDHGLLRRRNSHKHLVETLKQWGALPESLDVKRTCEGMRTKLKSPFPTTGYRDWPAPYVSDRQFCQQASKLLDRTVAYCR